MPRFRHPYFLTTATLLLVLLVIFARVHRPVKEEKEVNLRQAESRFTPMKMMVPVWMWRGLRVDLAVAGMLLALTPIATRRLSSERPDRSIQSPALKGWEWAGMAVAVALFTSAGVPRLGHSLWGDEEYAAGKFVADRVTVASDGSMKIEPVPWMDTLWNYWRPTNHVGYTVVARLFHDAFFHRPTGPKDTFVNESLIRLPVLLAGIGWLLTLLWACRVWGWNIAAVPLALGLAGHAWLIRFGVDARGYGFVVLLVLLLLAFLGRALQTGFWRWWLAYGLAQFYLLWTYPGSVHVHVTLNLAAIWLIWSQEQPADRKVMLTRWLVANLVTTLLVIGLMAPLLVPFLGFLKINRLAGDLDITWFQDAASYAVCGAPWLPWSATNPYSTALSTDGLPKILDITLLSFAWALAILGAWGVWQKPSQRGLFPFLIGGPALLLLHLVASHTRPYHWYLIPFLPALLLLWASAFTFLWERNRPATIALIVVLVGGIHAMGWQQKQFLVEHPIEANRESVALTRKVTNPRNPDYNHDEITASCIMTPGCYDPGSVIVHNAEELRQLMARAAKEHRQLMVNFGFRDLYKIEKPDVLALLDDRSQFEPVATMPGLFFSTTREVVRFKGAGTAAP